MAEKIISKEAILSANTYVKTLDKDKFVQAIVLDCLDSININTDAGDSLPPMYKENAERKARHLMGALLSMYLKDKGFIPVENTECMLSADDYDRYAGSHILNQMERFKSDKDTRDIVFDILQDYQDLCKRLNIEVYSYLQVMNDPASRLMAAINQKTTPEALQSAIQDVKNLEEQFKQYTGGKDHTVIEE